MKRFLAVVMGVALCLMLAAGASAVDRSSLENKTTEGLYDRHDAFDLARDAGLLYQVEPLHLWTVGSGYSGSDDFDSDSFLVGAGRKLGPGSLALFFETNRDVTDETTSSSLFYQEEFGTDEGFQYWDPQNQWPNYDGTYDLLADGGIWSHYEYDREEQNYSIAYSLPLTDTIAVGASYDPQFIDEEETIEMLPGFLPLYAMPFLTPPIDLVGGGSPTDFFYFLGTWFYGGSTGPGSYWLLNSTPNPVFTGPNLGGDFSFIYYLDVEHSANLSATGSAGFEGSRDEDRKVHPVQVRSHIRPNDNWEFLLGVGYADVSQDDEVHGVFGSTAEFSFEDVDGNYLVPGALIRGTSDFTFTVDGSLRDEWGSDGTQAADGGLQDDHGGDQWSAYVSPTYHFNERYSARLDLGYSNEDGDFTGGILGRLDFDQGFIVDDTANSERLLDVSWSGWELWDGRSRGDYESTSWSIEPRLYIDFDKVRFSAALGYAQNEDEWDGTMTLDKTAYYAFRDNIVDLIPDPPESLAWTFEGSWTGVQDFKGEETTTIVRLPVAAEFDITNKLTARAGAAYYRVHNEQKRTDEQTIREDERWTIKDENGVVQDVGPEVYLLTAGGTGTPYDDDAWGCSLTQEYDETYDYTTYHVGLGYYFTDNLQFDLMFTGMSGWVDSSMLYGSFTIIFP